MASATRRDRETGIEFVVEDDGTITARDLESGLARGGATRGEALSQLAEVLTLEEDGGETIEDPDWFLSDRGIEPASDVDEPDWE